jgi:hypothetical protein
MADCVAKLCEGRLACNNVIEARRFLNQHCVSATNLESSLRVRMRKIVLQQYLPTVDSCTAAKKLLDHLIGALGASAANLSFVF